MWYEFFSQKSLLIIECSAPAPDMVQTLVLSTETYQETLGMDFQHSQVVFSGLGIDY